MIRNKKSGFNPGSLLLLGRRSVGTIIRSAILMLIVALLAASPLPVSAATPDPVLEWIGVMNTTVLTAGTAPNVTSRVVALVSASVFDAVNGIEPRFRPIHVKPNAPHNASQSAAAIQAAYAILFNLYPSGTLTARRDASIAALASTAPAVPRRTERGRLAPYAARQRFRRNTADRHHDAVGTHSAIAVPLAAAPGSHQPGVR